ncbi:MAG: nucleoside hydrolase [Deltaproteobacteria bacterium]|nr:nucleoside hydrolase [Deltaproteobacteria bacterium]
MKTITSAWMTALLIAAPLLAACAHKAAAPAPAAQAPVKVIYDTDMALDVDDVGGLAMLHKMQDAGECEVLGVVVSESLQNYDGIWTPPLVDVVNTYYGRPNIPIGVFKGPHQNIGRVGPYAEKVVKAGLPHDLKTGADAEDGVQLYRRLLAAQPDASVTIISVGYLTNLDGLLQSPADELSPLTGRELVERKVKLWSCMGGGYPTSGEDGEFNLDHYGNAAERVINNWPGRAVFGGYELGRQYFVGGELQQLPNASRNPVALSWLHFNGGQKRESWDELSVLYGVRGAAFGGVTYFGLVQGGSNHYEMLGKVWPGSHHEKSQNTWVPSPVKDQAYLVPAAPVATVEAIINEMIMAPPGRPPS